MFRSRKSSVCELATVAILTCVFTSLAWNWYFNGGVAAGGGSVYSNNGAAVINDGAAKKDATVGNAAPQATTLVPRPILTDPTPTPIDKGIEELDALAKQRKQELENEGQGVTKRKFAYVILTSSAYHDTRIPALLDTWGRHANIIFIGSDSLVPSLPLVKAFNQKGKAELGKKAMYMMEEFCKTEADFYVMADDDTFVIVHNLEFLFSKQFDPEKDLYAGYTLKHFKPYVVGGGGGIVLSRSAMKKMCAANKIKHHPCNPETYQPEAGDAAVLLCMAQLGISSTHVLGFNPFPVDQVDHPAPNWCTITWWFPKDIPCPPVGPSSTFHYIPVEKFHEYYYWTYNFTWMDKPSPRKPSPYV
jgi:hypothetical protein